RTCIRSRTPMVVRSSGTIGIPEAVAPSRSRTSTSRLEPCSDVLNSNAPTSQPDGSPSRNFSGWSSKPSTLAPAEGTGAPCSSRLSPRSPNGEHGDESTKANRLPGQAHRGRDQGPHPGLGGSRGGLPLGGPQPGARTRGARHDERGQARQEGAAPDLG